MTVKQSSKKVHAVAMMTNNGATGSSQSIINSSHVSKQLNSLMSVGLDQSIQGNPGEQTLNSLTNLRPTGNVHGGSTNTLNQN